MIALDELSFGYRRSDPIIEGLSYRFHVGTTTAVTGQSGRGKSTLLYLVGLLLTPWSGTIRVAGVKTAQIDDRARSRIRAEHMGFVFQDAALDASRTVIDNVIESSVYTRLSRKAAQARARDLMDRFGVGLQADHRPGEVSGGQAQRVALCRALLGEPDLVLADEPTGNLDSGTSGVVMGALTEYAHDLHRTVIVATHDPSIIAACDQVLKL